MKKKKLLALLLIAAGCFAFASSSDAQTTAGKNIVVSGTVVDASNAPIIGAGVTVKGTTNGTVTDINGKYTITVPSGSTLSISSLGYVEQELKADRGTINVVLAEDSEMLQETVVIGYGVQKKVDVTGAVSSVGSKDLANRPAADLSGMLAGKVSGVQVLPSSGQPGEVGQIRVRGISSNSTSSVNPLYIVDGLQVSDINFLDPANIESIDILKDGASAAIYGAQAGNGVILITTKKGQKGEGQIFYDGSYTISKLGYHPTMMNAAQYKEYMTEAGILNQATLDAAGYDGKTDTNWAEQVYETGHVQKHTIGVKGASDKGSIYAALSIYDEKGILITDKDYYKRFNVQINGDYNIKKWLKVGTSNNLSISDRGLFASHENDNRGISLKAMGLSPLQKMFYDKPEELSPRMKTDYDAGKNLLKWDGRFIARDEYSTGVGNPLAYMCSRDDYSTKTTALNGTTYLELKPVKGLVITSRIGYTFSSSNSGYFQAPFYYSDSFNKDQNQISNSVDKYFKYNWENFANYNVTIAKNHNLSAMVGMSFIQATRNKISVVGNDVPSNASNFRYLDYLPEKGITDLTGSESKAASMSYFARLGYNYKSKYFVQATFRADAFDSSKLPSSGRWGYFPSVSAGWTISNEDFMANTKDVLSFLKIRGSWGINGNVDVLSGYPYAATVQVGNSKLFAYMENNNTMTFGSAPDKLPNNDLKWETAYQWDLGVDARFFDDRLSFAFDYYNKDTRDLLVEVTPALITGQSKATINAGSINNKGFDIELGWKDRIGDFSYGVNANLSHNTNMVTYLDPTLDYIAGISTATSEPITRFAVGHPTWFFYGYKFTGIDRETGEPTFDAGDDGILDANDRGEIGNALPKFTYGISVNLAWKGLDLLIHGTGSQGNQIFYNCRRYEYGAANAPVQFYNDRWTPQNKDAQFGKAGCLGNGQYMLSSAMVFDGSYFKIDQIQLGYTLPQSVLKAIHFSNIRVFASLENFFTFSKYLGYDPSIAGYESTYTLGVDVASYALAKKIMFGVNLSF